MNQTVEQVHPGVTINVVPRTWPLIMIALSYLALVSPSKLKLFYGHELGEPCGVLMLGKRQENADLQR